MTITPYSPADYEGLPTTEYDNRLHSKLLLMGDMWLANWIICHAYEEVSELFNNEILDEWEAEQETEE